MTRIIRSTVFISLAGHLAIFYLFSFSFGRASNIRHYAPVHFWGQIFSREEILPVEQKRIGDIRNRLPARPLDGFIAGKRDYFERAGYDFKPKTSVSAYAQRAQPSLPGVNFVSLPPRGEPTITFHPALPYGFQLYFKDRQNVHIELLFNIVSRNGKGSVVVRRKISSGNLIADLLSARYISHYLFVQRARFAPDNWQTVKIDLSP